MKKNKIIKSFQQLNRVLIVSEVLLVLAIISSVLNFDMTSVILYFSFFINTLILSLVLYAQYCRINEIPKGLLYMFLNAVTLNIFGIIITLKIVKSNDVMGKNVDVDYHQDITNLNKDLKIMNVLTFVLIACTTLTVFVNPVFLSGITLASFIAGTMMIRMERVKRGVSSILLATVTLGLLPLFMVGRTKSELARRSS